MPKGIKLSEFEKGQVIALDKEGFSHRDIAKKLGRSRAPIDNFLKDPTKYNSKNAGGRPKVLSPRDKRLILGHLRKNRRESIPSIIAKTSIKASNSTIRRLLQANNITRKKMKGHPRLLPQHKVARLEFARKHQTWDDEWKTVVSSDEKKFNLDGPDGYKYFWADKNMPETIYSRRQNAGGSVMVWGAISAKGTMDLQIMNGRYNANRYIEMLDNACLFEEGHRLCPEKFIFQQDGATIHTAKSSMEYFDAMGIEVLPWPARSPDLNPIENVWGKLSNEIYKEGRQYDTVNDLKNAIMSAWGNLNEDYLTELISSMKNRVFEVINKNGGVTHY